MLHSSLACLDHTHAHLFTIFIMFKLTCSWCLCAHSINICWHLQQHSVQLEIGLSDGYLSHRVLDSATSGCACSAPCA